MSKRKTNTSSVTENNATTTPIEQNTSSTVEQNTSSAISSTVENNTLMSTQANGEEFALDLQLVYKADTKQSVASATTMAVGEMLQAFNGVQKGYFTMLSRLAVIIGNNYHKNIVGIKSPQELLTKVVGTSRSTASEMVKVAKTFYTNLGNLKNEELGLFTYSELIKLSNCDESLIDDVITRIKAIDGAHTRADVITAIQEATNKALGVSEDNDEQTDSEQTDSEQTDSEQTDSEQTSEDFHKVDSEETPFKTDWQAEYINIANNMTDIADNFKKELDNPHADFKEIATIAYDTMNSIIKAMLERIAGTDIEYSTIQSNFGVKSE